jgi:hypothetical protein
MWWEAIQGGVSVPHSVSSFQLSLTPHMPVRSTLMFLFLKSNINMARATTLAPLLQSVPQRLRHDPCCVLYSPRSDLVVAHFGKCLLLSIFSTLAWLLSSTKTLATCPSRLSAANKRLMDTSCRSMRAPAMDEVLYISNEFISLPEVATNDAAATRTAKTRIPLILHQSYSS